MTDGNPTKKEIVGLVEAQANSIDDFSKRLVKVEALVEKQDSKNQNIIIGVVVAFILIVGSVAVEVLLSNRTDRQFYSGLENNIYEQNLKIQDMNNNLGNIKVRNPYLR